MAKDKKSFVLYCDLIHTVRKLPKEDAGELFMHILEYVNDLNPETDNPLVDIAFEPIKQSLKRDLKKYESRAERARENGKKGGRPKKPKKTQSVISKPKKPDSVSDSVSVNDIKKEYKEIFSSWVEYRRLKKKPINNPKTLESLIKKFESHSVKDCEFVVNNSIENDWQGLFWDKIPKKTTIDVQQPKRLKDLYE